MVGVLFRFAKLVQSPIGICENKHFKNYSFFDRPLVLEKVFPFPTPRLITFNGKENGSNSQRKIPH